MRSVDTCFQEETVLIHTKRLETKSMAESFLIYMQINYYNLAYI